MDHELFPATKYDRKHKLRLTTNQSINQRMDDFPHSFERDAFLGALRYNIFPEDVMDLLNTLKIAEQLTIETDLDTNPCLITLTLKYDQLSKIMKTPIDFSCASFDETKLSTQAEFFLLHIFYSFLRDKVNNVKELTLKGFDRKFETRFLSAFRNNGIVNLKLSTLSSATNAQFLDFEHANEYWEIEWTSMMNRPSLCQEFSSLREFSIAPCRPLNAQHQHNLGQWLCRMGNLESFAITQRPKIDAHMFDSTTFDDIVHGLRANPLKKLLLDVSPSEMRMWTRYIKVFPGLQSVYIKAAKEMSDQTVLPLFLRELPAYTLKVIGILECPLYSQGAVELAKILSFNCLECFCICNSSGTPLDSVAVVVAALRKNRSVKKFTWKHTPIKMLMMSKYYCKELALLLENHPTLHDVEIVGADLDVEDVAWICQRVRCNPMIQRLTIGSCEWGIEAFRGIRELLEGHQSSHLQKLTLIRMGDDECVAIFTPTVKELARGIAANKTLLTLNLNFYLAESDEKLFVDAFEHNLSITRLEGHIAASFGSDFPREGTKRLNHYLELNQFGRKLALDSDFPVQLWPELLEKASRLNLSTLYYFLGQKPDIFAIL